MKLVVAALLIALTANPVALAQYTFDAKGRRYPCVTGDWSCQVLPPPGAPLQPLPVERRRPQPPPYAPCGSRCDLLDRMK
jgi:hypothetical protein